MLIFKFQIHQFKKKDEAVNAGVNLALTEGQISTCKATQTDFDVPESAGKRSKLLPGSEIFPSFTLLYKCRLTANSICPKISITFSNEQG